MRKKLGDFYDIFEVTENNNFGSNYFCTVKLKVNKGKQNTIEQAKIHALSVYPILRNVESWDINYINTVQEEIM